MYCTKCVKKQEGHYFCGVCLILIKRPPNRDQLMELKSKDLQQYLNKNKISTHGLVEKTELVELFCRISIPVRHKKSNKKFPINLGGSVPDLAAQSQHFLNNLRSNAEAAFQNSRGMWTTNQSYSATTSPTRQNIPPTRNQQNRTSQNSEQNPPNINRRSSNNIPTNQPTSSQTQSQQQQQRHSPEFTRSAATEEYHPPRKLLKLSDFTSEHQLNDLTVKQLKELLTLNRVDYKGCVEKGELLERVVMLWVDSNLHKNDSE
ncbi:caspase regulator ring finger domain-containing [Holotrichia oblita]|uniref:Caspase regulator ring finger domain-containing n=1 Tax=Holotrichia oblita TaxID=644536 RepID=A0ACB9T2Y7_HOLOL|nr:caspase regulator ring finger domain-containing [Holotrichia oblita]